MRWVHGVLLAMCSMSVASGQQKIMTEEEFVQQGEQWGGDDGMPADPRCPEPMNALERCVIEDDKLRGPTLKCLQQVESTARLPDRNRTPPPAGPAHLLNHLGPSVRSNDAGLQGPRVHLSDCFPLQLHPKFSSIVSR